MNASDSLGRRFVLSELGDLRAEGTCSVMEAGKAASVEAELRWLYGVSRPSRIGYKKGHENRKFYFVSKSGIKLTEPSIPTRL